MSRQAKISLMGLSNWNDGLFDLLVIPEGLNKDTFTDNLVTETAELEVLYPNYEVMRTLIGVWSHKMLPVWQHLYDTTMYEYDPIQNYNRTEIETISGEGNRVHSGTDSTTTGGTDTTTFGGRDVTTTGGNDTTTFGGRDVTTMGGSDTSTMGGADTTTHGGQNSHNQTTTRTGDNRHSIAGFDSVPTANSDGLVLNDTDDAHSTEIISGSETFGKTETLQHGRTETLQHGRTETLQHGRTETLQHGKTETLQHEKTEALQHGKTEQLVHGEHIADTNESTRENHTSGNIGVTTTQKMIREEREIAEFNIYDRMIKDFMDRFCIMVF